MTAMNGGPGPSGPGPPAGSNGPALQPEIRLTTEWVAGAMGGTARHGDPDREFNGVSIDTRTLTAGELFFAIRGERFNGADFAGAAIDAGAGGIVVERGRGSEFRSTAKEWPPFAVIEVDGCASTLHRGPMLVHPSDPLRGILETRRHKQRARRTDCWW